MLWNKSRKAGVTGGRVACQIIGIIGQLNTLSTHYLTLIFLHLLGDKIWILCFNQCTFKNTNMSLIDSWKKTKGASSRKLLKNVHQSQNLKNLTFPKRRGEFVCLNIAWIHDPISSSLLSSLSLVLCRCHSLSLALWKATNQVIQNFHLSIPSQVAFYAKSYKPTLSDLKCTLTTMDEYPITQSKLWTSKITKKNIKMFDLFNFRVQYFVTLTRDQRAQSTALRQLDVYVP